MDKLYDLHDAYIRKTQTNHKRYLINAIDWDSQLIGIKGSKGIGKTTLMLQYIKENLSAQQALYISMDSIVAKQYTIFDIAEYHINRGGTHLFVDEIHKYADWSSEIKTIYDLYPDLHIVFSGSSILQIYKSFADLSRRALSYDLHGLSFREFIHMETGIDLPKINIEDLVKNHVAFAEGITKEINVFTHWQNYLSYGYYPFYREDKKNFALKLENVINNALDVDLPYALEINVHNIFKIKKLLHILATELPFQPNVSKLAGSLELNRNTLNNYLYYLAESNLIQLLLDAGKSYSTLSKPEKIYMHNTNLIYAITREKGNKGTLREIFFFNQVNAYNKVNYTKQGDFVVDNKYIFEIGGASKTTSQIKDIKNSFLAVDDILIGRANKIPLWLFGFLY
jgi:predicted AAA+ superfamily ATPase